jgi:hypothetical protein
MAMDTILSSLLLVLPVLGAAAGYLVDGVIGASAGIAIPMGPLVVMWLFGTR